MIDVSQDIHSLTTFKRGSNGLIKRMKKTGRPLVLTVKGKAEAVIMYLLNNSGSWKADRKQVHETQPQRQNISDWFV